MRKQAAVRARGGDGTRRQRGRLLPIAALLFAACSGHDVTTLSNPETEGAPLAPEPTDSRAFSVLTEPESLVVLCRFVGVSSAPGGAQRAAACSNAVERCRDQVGALFEPQRAPAARVPSGDLREVAGCPLTYAQLDACVGAALERGVARHGADITCDRPAPGVDALELFASPECLSVALLCPQLLGGLMPRFAPGRD